MFNLIIQKKGLDMLKGLSIHPSNRHYTLSATLLCSVSSVLLFSVAHAATIGKTTVTSAQNESLSASIEVSDISAADFSADLANPVVYEQLGLKPTTSMAVSFKSTSDTSGLVLISTSQPVSMPFADVVLAINDNGRRNTIPKTLLMPLNNSIAAPKATHSNDNLQTLTVRREAPPSLFADNPMHASSISAIQPTAMPINNRLNNAEATSDMQVLAVKHEAPPLLFKLDNLSLLNANAAQSTTSPQNSDNTQVLAVRREAPPLLFTDLNMRAANASGYQPLAMSSFTNSNEDAQVLAVRREAPPSLFASDDMQMQASMTFATSNNKNAAANILTDRAPNKPSTAALKALSVTNDIQMPVNELASDTNLQTNIIRNDSASPFLSNSSFKDSNTPNMSNLKIKYIDIAFISKSLQKSADTTAPLSAAVFDLSASDSIEDLTTNYTVQVNDNLWVISKQIALQNNSDVSTVMAKIKDKNPTAFVAQDSNLLMANVQLDLTDFDIVPSQLDLQVAITEYRQSYV